jgi:hypothetical protein
MNEKNTWLVIVFKGTKLNKLKVQGFFRQKVWINLYAGMKSHNLQVKKLKWIKLHKTLKLFGKTMSSWHVI